MLFLSGYHWTHPSAVGPDQRTKLDLCWSQFCFSISDPEEGAAILRKRLQSCKSVFLLWLQLLLTLMHQNQADGTLLATVALRVEGVPVVPQKLW